VGTYCDGIQVLSADGFTGRLQFANAMGTSVDTIRSWETKRRNPTGLAAKVLATLRDNPAFLNELASH